jgi:hypothetical protein
MQSFYVCGARFNGVCGSWNMMLGAGDLGGVEMLIYGEISNRLSDHLANCHVDWYL